MERISRETVALVAEVVMCTGTDVGDDRRVVGRELVLSEPDNHSPGSYVGGCRNGWTRMSPQTNLDSVRAFLEGPNRAVLATLGPTGGPHVVVVDYLVTDDALLLNGRRDRRWVANLRQDPRATALVHDPHSVEHWVSIDGSVELMREGDDASIEDAKTMSRRYGDDPEQFNAQHRVTWRLVPERVFERTT